MCRKDTHAMRGHRSKKNWKPFYKAIKNRQKKMRREVRKLIGAAGGRTLYESLPAMR